MRTAFVLSLAGFVSALAIAPVKADDIVIAVAGPMTGPVAAIGDQMKRGAETAAAAINEAGGIAGRNVKIVVEDDVCDPKQAVAVANLIVGQQIKFVDGHACSGSSIPASDVYNDNKVLMMSPASTNPALTEKGYPTIMRDLPARRRAGRLRRAVDHQELHRQEDRHPPRQVGLRQRPGDRSSSRRSTAPASRK